MIPFSKQTRAPAYILPLPPLRLHTPPRASTTAIPNRPSLPSPHRAKPRPRRARPAPSPDSLLDFSREIADHSLLSLQEERALLLKLRPLRLHARVRADLAAENGTLPTDHQLAAALGYTHARLLRDRRKALRARDALVNANLRLVVRVASRVHRSLSPQQGTGVISLTDLIQEGSLALIRAAENFDTAKGTRFAPYACRAIWSRCRRVAMPASCIVSLPERLRVAANKLSRFRAEYRRQNGHNPSLHAQAALTPAEPLRLVLNAEKHLHGGVFLDAPLGVSKRHSGGRDVTALDTLSSARPVPEEVVDRELVRKNVREACYKRLSSRDADILAMRFGLDDGKPVLAKDIAAQFGISAPRVTQIVLQAMEKLRVSEPELADHIHDL